MTPLPTIPQRVEKGIAWLEEQGAHDWAEKIVAAADSARFSIIDCERCAVGTPLGADFGNAFSFSPTWVRACGFEISSKAQDSTWEHRRNEYAALEAEWLRQARERLAWLAEIDS